MRLFEGGSYLLISKICAALIRRRLLIEAALKRENTVFKSLVMDTTSGRDLEE